VDTSTSTIDVADIDMDFLAEPTGEGLSKREAQQLLIDEMNGIVNARNQRRLFKYGQQMKKWEDNDYRGIMPIQPPIVKGYSRRRLNQAVAAARGQGILKELLANAGF
jgi:hypothetical protein